jgi:AcrR family transcriptional regulator
VHDAILAATRDLLVEGGYAEVSMDRVAEQAGVGRQTIYRRWPSKAPLVAEAVLESYEQSQPAQLPDTDDVIADLRVWMDGAAEFVALPEHTVLLRALAAAAAEDSGDNEMLFQQLTSPQRERLATRLRTGMDAGQIRAGVDAEAVAEALIGAVLIRLLAPPVATDGVGRTFDGLFDAIVGGLTPR